MLRLLCSALVTITIGGIVAGILFPVEDQELAPQPDHAGLVPVGDIKISTQPARAQKPFRVTIYINGHEESDRVTLILPAGLSLVGREGRTREIPPLGTKQVHSRVSWQIIGQRPGTFRLAADCPAIGTAYIDVPIGFP